MNNPNWETFVAIILLEVITDVSSSIFIIISLAGSHISPLSRILISLNASNLFFTLCMSAYTFTGYLWSYMYSVRSVFYLLSYVTAYSITSSAWLTAVLCFFYFMKIIPSRPGLLQNIKNRIGAIVWRLILMVEIVSLSGNFLTILLSLHNPNKINSTVNNVETLKETRGHDITFKQIVLILNSLPFIVIVVTTVTSAWFLRVYDCQIKRNNGTLVNTNVKDYRSAVHTMMGLLIFYLFVILAVVLLTLKVFVDRSAGFWVCVMTLLSFPTGQSALLISSNPKLKQILKELFTSLTCRDSDE